MQNAACFPYVPVYIQMYRECAVFLRAPGKDLASVRAYPKYLAPNSLKAGRAQSTTEGATQ